MSLCSMWTDKHDQAIDHLLQMLKEYAKKYRGVRSSDCGGLRKMHQLRFTGGFFVWSCLYF